MKQGATDFMKKFKEAEINPPKPSPAKDEENIEVLEVESVVLDLEPVAEVKQKEAPKKNESKILD